MMGIRRALKSASKSGLPLVILKLAQSLDGSLWAEEGQQTWFSCERSRFQVQRLRSLVDAVLVGANTVRVDNPKLTNRRGIGTQPQRVVLSGSLNLDRGCEVFKSDTPRQPRTIVYTYRKSLSTDDDISLEPYAQVRCLEPRDSGSASLIDLELVLRDLSASGVRSVLCEGGASVAAQILGARLVDYLLLYIAPVLACGSSSLGDEIRRSQMWEAGKGKVFSLKESAGLDLFKCKKVGTDILALYRRLG